LYFIINPSNVWMDEWVKYIIVNQVPFLACTLIWLKWINILLIHLIIILF